MKQKEVRQVLPMNLQFFASKDDDNNDDVNAGETGNEGDGNADDSDDDIDDDNTGKDDKGKASSKTFTQAEVTAMMTREKKEGRKALLKQLGFKSEAEAKSAIALYNALVDSQKTEEQKNKEAADGLETAKTEAEKRAEAAEDKLACVIAGVKKDSIDDALAIAKLKVTEEKSLDKVLAEMKKETRYAGFFGEDDGDKDDGTGSEPGHSKNNKDNKKGSYGSKLAKETQSSSKKKTYF